MASFPNTQDIPFFMDALYKKDLSIYVFPIFYNIIFMSVTFYNTASSDRKITVKIVLRASSLATPKHLLDIRTNLSNTIITSNKR